MDYFSCTSSGLVFVISAPSGAGKTTLARALVKSMNNLRLSISVTTRLPRLKEVDGFDYIFINQEDFLKLQESDGLLEYTNAYTNSYGTPKDFILRSTSNKDDVILVLDFNGAKKLSEFFGKKCITIYIMPPSIEALQARLSNRKDKVQDIEIRIDEVRGEIQRYEFYDYVIFNDNFYSAIRILRSIINAERHKRVHMDQLSNFVNTI